VIALLDLVPRWVLVAALVAMSVLCGYLTSGLLIAKLDAANAQSEVASLRVEISDANAKAATQAATLSQAVVKAQNEAKNREAILRSAAAAAATESDGLRDDLSAARQHIDQLSRDAIVERSDAVSAVLADCSRRYQGMAEKAERHASDVKTLIDAWPKSPPPGSGELNR